MSDKIRLLNEYCSMYGLMGFNTFLIHSCIKQDGKKSTYHVSGKIPMWLANGIEIQLNKIATVIDFDYRNGVDGFENFPEHLKKLIDPATVRDQSQSGATRFWFRGNSELHDQTGYGDRIDLITKRIIAPPSTVKNGGSYNWVVPLARPELLLPLPQPIFQFFYDRQVEYDKKHPASSDPSDKPTIAGVMRIEDLKDYQKSKLFTSLNSITGSRTAQQFFCLAVRYGLDREIVWNLAMGNAYTKKRNRKWFDWSIDKAIRFIGV